MAIQTEDFNVKIENFDGWQTSRDSDDIGDSKSPNVLNVRFNGSNVRGSQGYANIGTRRSGAGEIVSQYTYNRNDGQERMVRVRDDLSNTIVEWWDTTNEEWYILLPGQTTGKVMGFAEYNTSSTNNLLFCNGVNNLTKWTGATTRLTAAVSGSPSSISVASTADFPSSGTIIYNGTEVAYTSKTATTFVKSSGSFHDSAGTDDGVAEAADDSTHSGVTKGNILLSAKDRLWIAGQPGAPTTLDYSDEGSFSTFTGGANRADSGLETFFNIGGAITGLSEKGEEIIVLGEDGADGFSFTYPTSTTKAPNFREIFRAKGQGCTNHKSVFKVNNDVYFTNKNGIISITDLEGTEKVFTRSITREILPTTKQYDFSESASIFFDKEDILLVSCKSDSDFPANDTVIGVEFYIDKEGSERIALTRFNWIVNDWAILNDILYAGSSLEQNSYRCFYTNQNDGAPRTIRYATKRFHFKNPFQEKGNRIAAVRGFIKDGSDIDVDILYNAGFKGTQSKTIESTGAYVSQSTLNTIGAFALGTNPIGASLDEVSDLKRFLVYLDLGVDYTWNDIQMVFSSDTDGGTFIIDYIGLDIDSEGYASQDQLTI